MVAQVEVALVTEEDELFVRLVCMERGEEALRFGGLIGHKLEIEIAVLMGEPLTASAAEAALAVVEDVEGLRVHGVG